LGHANITTAFLEGLGGQGSDIDAIFEIEAQVVDEYLNEQLDHQILSSKPNTPTRSPSSAPSNPSSPSIQVPTGQSSRPNVAFPGSESPLPAPERSLIGSESSSAPVFGDLESPTTENPVRYRLSPPSLPPRHVRTRRDSTVLQMQRALATTAAANNTGVGTANPSISTVLDLEPTSVLDASPLGLLFGTVVEEGNKDPFSISTATGVQLGRGIGSITRRSQAMSTSADAGAPSRRHSSNVSVTTKPKLSGMADMPQPETVQEVLDEEESGIDVKKGDEDVIRMLGELERRQEKMEGQLDQLLAILQHRR